MTQVGTANIGGKAVTFARYGGNPVLDTSDAGSWTAQHMYLDDVVWDGANERYLLYWNGRPGEGQTNCIGVAYSSDGQVWTVPGSGATKGQALTPSANDNNYVGFSAAYIEGGTYYLIYAPYGGTVKVASSPNGIDTWTRLNGDAPVFTLAGAEEWEETSLLPESLIKIGSTYYLFYSAADAAYDNEAFGVATAPSITGPYTRHAGNPILQQGGAVYESNRIVCPDVFEDGGSYHMVYAGIHDEGLYGHTNKMLLAMAISSNALDWEKVDYPKTFWEYKAANAWENYYLNGRAAIMRQENNPANGYIMFYGADNTADGKDAIGIATEVAYSYYAKITIQNGQVAGDETDFTVLISGTYDGTDGEPDIRTVANGGKVQNTALGGASGAITVPADLAFSPNVDGSSPYNFEIEKYVPATGEIVAWVKVPALSSTIDTVLYMAYGDAAITVSQENVKGTWDVNFKGVWHLGEGGGTGYDSTANGNHLSDNVSATGTLGKIGNGQEFDGVDDYMDRADNASLSPTNITIEAWVRRDATKFQKIADKWYDGSTRSYTLGLGNTDIVRFEISRNGAETLLTSSTGTIPLTTWAHVVGKYDGSTMSIHINGGVDGSDGSRSGTIYDNGEQLTIGLGAWNNDEKFDGHLDEVRVSSIARSANYIATTYNAQNSPSTFYSMGAEQEAVCVVTVTVSVTITIVVMEE